MSGDEPQLPEHWAEAALGDIADVQLGKMLDRSRKKGTPLPYLRNINVRWGSVDTSDLLEMPFRDEELERYSVCEGDVMVCEGGEPGRSAVWRRGTTEIKYQKALHRVRMPEGFLPDWLVYHLMLDAGLGGLERRFTGTTIKHFTRVALRRYPLRIAPLPEQHRIVAALETHFSRLDAAVAALERARANLRRYRASVLKAACEGRLVPTEDELARREGGDYEPADRLLERILVERRRRWEEAERKKLISKGKEPKGDGWKKRYKEPQPPQTADLPPLPRGWCWATLDAVAELQGGLTKGKKRRSKDELCEVPYLRVANVQRGYLDLGEVRTIEATVDEVEKLRLLAGDVLFTEGGDRDKLGRGWIWSGEIEDCIHQNHIFRARLFHHEVSPRYVSWFGNTSGRDYFFRQGKQTTNLASINLTKLRELPIALPPAGEQVRIVEAVEDYLSIVDSTSASIEANLRRAERLRQSILKRAFEGKLVPQDPDDEPASVLLERIRAEREAGGKRGGKKRRQQDHSS